MLKHLSAIITGGGGGAAVLGSYLGYTAAAGTSNNVNPAGFGTGVGRLGVNTNAGDATFTGLIAGADGQLLLIMNNGSGQLTLAALNGGSGAGNQFELPADLLLPPNDGILLVYTTGSINLWQVAP